MSLLYLVLLAISATMALTGTVAALAMRRVPGRSGAATEAFIGVVAATFASAEMLVVWRAEWAPVVLGIQLCVNSLGAVAFFCEMHRRARLPFSFWADRSRRAAALITTVLGLIALVPGWAFSDSLAPVVWRGDRISSVVPLTTFGGVALSSAFGLFLWGYVQAVRNMRQGVPNARVWVIAFGSLVIPALNDFLLVFGVDTLPLLPVLFAWPNVVLVAVMVRRAIADAREIDRLRQGLELSIADRTSLLETQSSELTKARERLHETERLAAVGRVTAGVAHEINNPTAAAMANVSFARRALRGQGDPEIDEALADAEEALERSARIVQQLLDASRAHRHDAKREPVELSDVLRRAVGTVRAAEAAPFAVQTLGELDAWVVGDADRLVQIVTNLAANAVQAVKAVDERERGPERGVQVEVARVAGGVELKVVDQGTGMDAATLAKAREPFFTTKPPGKGTGLGLAVVDGLVRSLGGELHIESEPGRGTMMSFVLPQAAPPAAPEAPHYNSQRLPELRVLVIDDDPLVLNAYGRMLRRHGRVTLCDRVDSALAAVEEDDYDAIVCDVVMPDGGGPRVLRSLPENLRRRLLFITGGATKPEVSAFLAEQPRPVLFKPVSRTDLLAQLEELMEGRITLRPTPVTNVMV